MPFRVHFDDRRNFLAAEGSGFVTGEEIASAYEAAIRASEGRVVGKGSLTIVGPDTSLDLLDFEALERLKAHVRSWLADHPTSRAKSALGALDSLQLTVLNLWRALVESDSRINRDIRVFLSERDAVAWLTQPVQP